MGIVVNFGDKHDYAMAPHCVLERLVAISTSNTRTAQTNQDSYNEKILKYRNKLKLKWKQQVFESHHLSSYEETNWRRPCR